MKGLRFIVMSLVLLFSITIAFAQKEANIWYFGEYAGLDFNSGSPIVLTNSAMFVYHGCASIADVNGQLLFYTDGATVWNKNHNIMQNGTGLLGGSQQKVIIVPKPNSTTIYYVFTTQTYDSNNDIHYSEIDMSLNFGLGDITAIKNILLKTPVSGNLSAVKHANGKDIWVLTHGESNNNFYSFLVTASGVNTNPIVSSSGLVISGFADGGIFKISPDGKKLAMCSSFVGSQLFNFNNATGVVYNPIVLSTRKSDYGVEFSPSSNVLYITNYWYEYDALYQYDLTASNIMNSEIAIAISDPNGYGDGDIGFTQLQVAPDHKIYACLLGRPYIGVINFPDELGVACDFVENAVSLNGNHGKFGLPQFIQSYFSVGIQSENVCFGEATQFNSNISSTYDNLLWNFGDGTTSSDETPLHTYASPGDYTVTLTVTSGSQTSIDSRVITIYENPIAYQPQDMVVCDDDNDGFSVFELTMQNSAILNGQDPAVFEVLYYASMGDHDMGNAIADTENYNNTIAFGLETIIVSVKNTLNSQCEALTSFDIQVFGLPNLNQTISTLTSCDDTSVGMDTDGKVYFDLTQKETEMFNVQSSIDFAVKYFTDTDHLNEISMPTQYANTNSNETIYVEVYNEVHPECNANTTFDIEVFGLPTITTLVGLRQCDDDIDGFSAFNLNEAIDKITSNRASETITFYVTEADAIASNNSITNPTTYVNNTVSFAKVWARVENTNSCFRTSQINLTVTTTQIPGSFIREFSACEDLDGDATNGISIFDFSSVQSEIEDLFPSGQDLLITYYKNEADALAEENKIVDISNYSNVGYPNMQQIYVRVDSKIDNDCLGLGSHINLKVETMPEFTIETPQIVCSSDPTFTVVLDPIESGTQEVYSYSWVLDGIEVGTSATLEVSTPGTYSVTLTKTNGTGCSTTKEIFVNASELATITAEDIKVVELSDNNSITINTNNLGLGDYEFVLDHKDASYQDEPYFEHLRAGAHTLYVRDKKGCGIAELEVFIMGFPRFFTPNDDGFNDIWNIKGLGNEYTQKSTVYIFDRYGKLIKQMDPRIEGWNGTFNGEKLRPSDYWFVIELYKFDGTMNTYRGHFSLVR